MPQSISEILSPPVAAENLHLIKFVRALAIRQALIDAGHSQPANDNTPGTVH